MSSLHALHNMINFLSVLINQEKNLISITTVHQAYIISFKANSE